MYRKTLSHSYRLAIPANDRFDLKKEAIMKMNVGGFDRIARIVIGVVLLLVGMSAPISGTLQVVAFVVAGIALLTGIVQYCPLNHLFGIDTCKLEERK